MLCPECGNFSVNKALRKLGIEQKTINAVLLQEAEYAFAYDEGIGMNVAQVGGQQLFEELVGKPNFTVHFDGIAYPCEGMPSGPNIFFGNLGGLGGEDSGEPFCGLINSVNFNVVFMTFDATEKHTIGIAYPTETIHPIDPKYLSGSVAKVDTASVGQTIVVKAVDENGKPTEWEAVDLPSGGGLGGGLPVVELNTPLTTSDSVELSEVDSTALTALAQKRLPFAVLVKMDAGGVYGHICCIVSVMDYRETPANYEYVAIGYLQGISFKFTKNKDSSVWTFG